MQLGAKPDAPVLFGYQTVAGGPGDAVPSPSLTPAIAGWPTWPTTTDPWFVAVAGADVDGNGKRCYVVTSSWTGEMYVENEGE